MATANENSTFNYDPDTNYDEAIMSQQRDIEKEVAETQKLIGNRETFENLLKEFSDDVVYQSKIKKLQEKYSFFRRTRGDGNCFYRAFGFAYMEILREDKEELKRYREVAAKSKDQLVKLGFPAFTIEDFHDVFMEVINKVESGCSLDALIDFFNDQSYSDYFVVYLRLLVSGHLQKEADFYANFVEGGRTVKEFCQQEVEPMGKESDHIHIITLTSSTGVPVRVEYMDRGVHASQDPTVNHHDFPEDSNPRIFLLYRPGHYDILYR